MKRGKHICNTLKAIRKQIADANSIAYSPVECSHEGDCLGTCPACEAEVRYIEKELNLRRIAGKAVAIAGLSAGMLAFTACGDGSRHKTDMSREPRPVPLEKTGDSDIKGKVRSKNELQNQGNKTTAKFSTQPSKNKDELVTTGEITDVSADTVKKERLFGMIAEQPPSFPGGVNALSKYIKDNLTYPDSLKDCIQGRVIVSFFVEADGSVTNVKVVRGVHPLLDKEAAKVVGNMPKWNPGTSQGKPARTNYTVPIVFKME